MSTTNYPDLLSQAQPQIIGDKVTHQRALRSVDLLMQKSRITKAERKLLELQAKLIDDYEETLYPTPHVTPAAMLEHLIGAKEASQAEVARQTGISRSTISEVLNGKRTISVENAFLLADYFCVDPSLFLTRPSS